MRQTEHIYLISVVAEMLDMHPQTLRKYEREGFIDPSRSGTLRLYSRDDIVRLRLIKHFVEVLGLNLAGVQLTLNVVNDLLGLRSTLAQSKAADARAAVAQIDRVLDGRFAMRVVDGTESPAEPAPEALPPSTSVFDLRGGEAIQFMKTTQAAARE